LVSPQPAKSFSPEITVAQRCLAALAILAIAAVISGALGALGLMPLPASLARVADQHQVGRARVIVGGYYITQDFVSFGGSSLPPYVFAVAGQKDAPGVHVSPTLQDLAVGKVTAVIDTATGDGSASLPYQIHTLARWNTFIAAAIVGSLIALAFALWLAGPAVALLLRRS
jgi:hypothetical protein